MERVKAGLDDVQGVRLQGVSQHLGPVTEIAPGFFIFGFFLAEPLLLMNDAGPARSQLNPEPYSHVVLGGFQPFYFSGNEGVDFLVPHCVFPRGSPFRLTG